MQAAVNSTPSFKTSRQKSIGDIAGPIHICLSTDCDDNREVNQRERQEQTDQHGDGQTDTEGCTELTDKRC